MPLQRQVLARNGVRPLCMIRSKGMTWISQDMIGGYRNVPIIRENMDPKRH